MKFIRTALLLALPFYFISCGTQKKLPDYLERVTDTSGKGDVKITELRIQKNDILSIQVFSASTVPTTDILYNPLSSNTSAGGQGSSGGGSTSGYLVDPRGNIEYPRLGSFHAEGLTKDELAAQIKKRLTEPVELLKDPSVIIRFVNFKISVLGEVGNQGVINIPGERMTILEAVGLAGGITEYGLKNSVKIIRETNGKREIGMVDLSSDSLFQSPYYNLVQNDVVLVPPAGKKAKKAEQDVVLQRVSFGLSVITAFALIYNIFK
ncbi:MAG: polysaccharide biosynthesis/export family protein [Bacteroidota bacterium]|nr:polysaccharide biosynthesis/export family protein [Bacteroidota bacterium]